MPRPFLLPQPIAAPYSAQLDALRAIAAIWVVASHMRSWGLAAAPLDRALPISGHDAVIVFFVLSGFLISHAAARTDRLVDYAIDRISRLYSVALPILLGTWLIDSLLAAIAADAYAGHYEWAKPWIYIPLHLAFLGEAWHLREVPLSIPPYWSLHYEAWYYVAFAVIVYARGAWRGALLVLLALMLGPKLVVLWPVWLLGAAVYALRGRLRPDRILARGLVVASLVGYAALEISGLDHRLWHHGDALFTAWVGFGPGNARHFLADYIVAVLVAGLLIGLEHAAWRLPDVAARVARAAAGYSFTLYLLHGPFLLTAKNLIDVSRLTLGHSAALAAALALATILVGTVTEKRLGLWRRALRALARRGLVAR